MFRRLILLAASLFVVALLAAGTFYWWVTNSLVQPLSFEGDTYTLMVEPGSTLTGLARRLHSEGLTTNPLPMQLHARLAVSGKIHTGEYLIKQGETILDLVAKLLKGDVVLHRITFPEGRTVAQWLELVAAHPILSQQPLPDIAEVNALVTEEDGETAVENAEGWFFPDTYTFPRNRSPLDIFRQAHRQMQAILAEEWRNRAPDLPLESPYEALILASIIEKETGLASERTTIAGVFVRRLNKGMRLQTDPTVIYGLGESFDGNLTRKHLGEENPYNTYLISALPPTPIANPGREAIHAALNPEPGTALYFVARGDGSHFFSNTLDQHIKAVREYQLKRSKNYRSAPAGNQ